jgi:hypothetical protein
MKKTIKEEVHDLIDWNYNEVSIDKLKSDIVKLEEKGVTHIEFQSSSWDGDSSLEITPLIKRLETNEEYGDRMEKASKPSQRVKRKVCKPLGNDLPACEQGA